MKSYIGTKLIQATPMDRADYNNYRGWELPSNENGDDEGYLVEYMDGGKGNDSRHVGYISWSPKAQFEGAYMETSGLTFGLALDALKAGKRVARAGWNGKGQWVRYFFPGTDKQFSIHEHAPDPAIGDSGTFMPFVGLHNTSNQFIPWQPSQGDMLASDWQVL